MAIDRMDWHYGGDYPEDLPNENSGTHIGMYIAWAFSHELVGEIHFEEEASVALLEQLKRREITGLNFFIRECDEKLIDDDFNQEGLAFTLDYYAWEADTAFSRQFGCYMQDYCDVFNAHAESQGFEYPSVYHVEDTWENFERLKPTLDLRFEQWRQWKKPADRHTPRLGK